MAVDLAAAWNACIPHQTTWMGVPPPFPTQLSANEHAAEQQMMAQLLVFLPLTWETWLELLTSVVSIWEVTQQNTWKIFLCFSLPFK